ncbi:MAG: ATP-dependent Clp protease proteolytic subunit [Candidatus Lambdaproteobacteria bacterium]|nr:ATP-dependent Clp protease proteolytic subunit [Candidatus Lambdaproteobacteria bacterium]
MAEQEGRRDESSAITEKLLASRMVLVAGAVTSEMAAKVIQQLILLDQDDAKKPITLLVNCPGGEVHSGFAVYDMVRFISAPVVSVVIGLAASMGSIIPLAAPKGSRYSLPHAKFLIHQPLLVGYQGRATDLEIQAKEILRDRDRIVKLYAEHTGRPPETVAKDIDRDKWLTVEEALAYGLVDHVVASRAELPHLRP